MIIFLYIFERRILCRIFRSINDNNGWRIRSNNKVYDLYKYPDITRLIRISRLICAGHMKTLEEKKILERVLEFKVEGRRRVRWPKLRWEDCVWRDVQKVGMKNWWMVARDRKTWQRLDPGCNAIDDFLLTFQLFSKLNRTKLTRLRRLGWNQTRPMVGTLL